MTDSYSLRRDRLLSMMKKKGIDAFLVTNFVNVTYLTGFSGDDSYLFLSPKRAVLISDSRYDRQIAEESPDIEALIRKPGVGMMTAIRQTADAAAKGKKGVSLGVEADSMTLALAALLEKSIPDVTLRPTSSAVETLREIKDRTEIRAIREAVRCAEKGFEILRHSLRPDQTEIELRDELEYRMRKMGADDRAFPTIAAVGPRAALPHAVPIGRSRVQDSELLLIDWGAKKDFYVSDLTRVLITAQKPSFKLKKIYQTVLKAQKQAIRKIRPGVLGEEVDAAARRVIEEAGYGKGFNHGLGHGIGLVVHDRGRLSIGAKTPLRPGMVLTVEPGIYLPGWGGVRIEDDILVTRSGAVLLSDRFPKEFDEMIVDF